MSTALPPLMKHEDQKNTRIQDRVTKQRGTIMAVVWPMLLVQWDVTWGKDLLVHFANRWDLTRAQDDGHA